MHHPPFCPALYRRDRFRHIGSRGKGALPRIEPRSGASVIGQGLQSVAENAYNYLISIHEKMF
jgi:hypothetical protein